MLGVPGHRCRSFPQGRGVDKELLEKAEQHSEGGDDSERGPVPKFSPGEHTV